MNISIRRIFKRFFIAAKKYHKTDCNLTFFGMFAVRFLLALIYSNIIAS